MGEDASSARLDFLFPLMLCYVYPNPVSFRPVYGEKKAKYGVVGVNPGGKGNSCVPRFTPKPAILRVTGTLATFCFHESAHQIDVFQSADEVNSMSPTSRLGQQDAVIVSFTEVDVVAI